MYFTKENIGKPSVIAFWRLLHPTPCFHGLYFTLCENQQHILKHLSNHFMNGVVIHIFVCSHSQFRYLPSQCLCQAGPIFLRHYL